MRLLLKKVLKLNLKKTTLLLLEAFIILLLVISCILYKNWDSIFGKDEWVVTQYGPSELNSMFYTIRNQKREKLVVIDGGWKEDADYVRKVLKEQGNHVNVWIITHPHQDHCGAFTQIWPKKRNLKIDRVVTVKMASPEDCLAVAPWDSAEAYEEFLSLENVNAAYVKAGDTFSVADLQFKILSAFDEQVRGMSRDYLNDGSLMFKVTGPKKSMLFCADVGKAMSRYLRQKWGRELKADYVQMGHHGNGGLKPAFYKTVAPETAFFDAPEWLLHDKTGTYDTPEKERLMRTLGCEILAFRTAPNAKPL